MFHLHAVIAERICQRYKREMKKEVNREKKKVMSPLVATIILLVCAILLGTVVMNWGRDYINDLTNIEPIATSPVTPVDVRAICTDDPFIILQTRYVKGEITTAKYLEIKAILTNTDINSS